jgi:hypothetical protein
MRGWDIDESVDTGTDTGHSLIQVRPVVGFGLFKAIVWTIRGITAVVNLVTASKKAHDAFSSPSPSPPPQTPTSSYSIDRTSLNFTSASEGYSTQWEQYVTISNTRSGTLTNVNVHISSGGSAFEIIHWPNWSISGWGSSSIGIRPRTGLWAGTHHGQLTISAGGISRTVSLSFTVTAAASSFNIDTTFLDFGSVPSGYAVWKQYVTIFNNSPNSLTNVSAHISSGSGAFEIIDWPSWTIWGWSEGSTSVRPRVGLPVGTHHGELTITAGGVNHTVWLTFTVTAVQSYSISTTFLNFPQAQADYTTQWEQYVTITNANHNALSNVSAHISWGSDAFEITQWPDWSIAGWSANSIGIRPRNGLSAGTHHGELTISAGGANRTVSLSFTVAEAPTFSISTETLNFPSAQTGYSTQLGQHITINSTNSSTLTDISVQVTSGNSNFEIIRWPNTSIFGWNSDTVSVRPRIGLPVGTHHGQLTITAGSVSRIVALSFTVTAVPFIFEPPPVPINPPSNGSSQGASTWAIGHVDEAISLGLIPDDLLSNYQEGITREEFCRMVVRMLMAKSGTVSNEDKFISAFRINLNAEPFSDTSDRYIKIAFALRIVNGTGNGQFTPDRLITRQEAATMLRNAAAVYEFISFSGSPPIFPDRDTIAIWAVSAVDFVAAHFIMTGVGNNVFSPHTTYTREQAITTMLRLFHAFPHEYYAL